MADVAVATKKLNIGDLVEIDGRRYDVVSDRAGGVTLEPAITLGAHELARRHGERPATQEEIDSQLDLLPPDRDG